MWHRRGAVDLVERFEQVRGLGVQLVRGAMPRRRCRRLRPKGAHVAKLEYRAGLERVHRAVAAAAC